MTDRQEEKIEKAKQKFGDKTGEFENLCKVFLDIVNNETDGDSIVAEMDGLKDRVSYAFDNLYYDEFSTARDEIESIQNGEDDEETEEENDNE